MWGIIRHLDFGTSLRYEGQSVNTIIKRSLPVSAAVGILAYLLALIVGITVGSIAALKQNSKWDYASMAFAMLGISVPNFVLGPILVLIFSLASLLVAAFALGRLSQSEPHFAGADSLGALHGLHRATDAGGHARSAAFRLHSHGASKGIE